ncbi:uncharacterized protein LOC144981283 isoform X1 [Oryzias latipes]
MPKKNQRSQSQKARWKNVREGAAAGEKEAPQIVNLVYVSAESPEVLHGGQQTQKGSYADAVKRGRHPDSLSEVEHISDGDTFSAVVHHDATHKPPFAQRQQVHQTEPEEPSAGPSHVEEMKLKLQPSVKHVSASHSQSSPKYGTSRNTQCTANSQVFLAFLYENENITRADLDHVLDKGDAVYRQVRQRFPTSVYLATDELPEVVPARRSTYNVNMTLPAIYGSFLGGNNLPSLEEGLSHLSSDVQYALLIMSGLTVAVFRCKSHDGYDYGFFDPHSRTAEGLPSALESGTAVMLKFTRLTDMIDRIKLCHSKFDTQPSTLYELKPVEFSSVNTDNNRNVSDCRPTVSESHGAADGSTSHPAADQPLNISPHMSTSDVLMEEASAGNITSTVQQVGLMMSETTTEHEPSGESTSSHDVSVTDKNLDTDVIQTTAGDLPDAGLTETSINFSRLTKSERRKMRRRLINSQKKGQKQENKNSKERQRYKNNPTFRKKKTLQSQKNYSENSQLREKKKRNMKAYNKNCTIKNVDFQQKRKLYIRDRYRQSEQFRQKQKTYITKLYRQNEEFRGKQKMYIRNRYRLNEEFRGKQKMYIRNRYRLNEEFRQRQRFYMKHRSHQCYENDRVFRLRHRQFMKQMMRDRYRSNNAFRRMHNLRCAMIIRKKYRQMKRPTQTVETETDNSLIKNAISVFRSNIQAGPSYVCTVCHKASFPNQVLVCRRSSYVTNTAVIEPCLTGKYVHVCDGSCRDQPCLVPSERRKEWICHTCHSYVKKGAVPALAAVNNLELTEIPDELKDLNILERHLISKCIPFAKIIPLPKGRQRLIRGNVVCVPSQVQETVEALPRLRNESQVMRVKLKRRLCYKGHQLFQTVTWSKLVRALLKLKRIHPQYQDITIRDEAELCDPTLPDEDDDEEEDDRMDDGDYDEADLMEIDMCEKSALCESEHVVERLCDGDEPTEQQRNDEEENELPNGGFALESCLQVPDISEEIMCFSDNTYCVAPAERNSPVSFFRTPKLEAMAVPVQFPTGQNTLDEHRRIKVTPSGYFKARLFNTDDRFARDPTYLFFAQFVTEIHLANSSMMVQLRKGKTLTRDGRRITSAMLQDKQEVERLVRNKDAIRFMQPLRGTPAYWHKTTRDLYAMIRQLGTPTFFCTFSAAEMRWPEVITAVKRQQGEQVDFEALDWSEKCEILRSNPVCVMRLFDKRVECLFRDLLCSDAQPLGKVIDFFYRVEFQHRGSPHIHMMLWIDQAPQVEVNSDQTVCDFVDRYISAQLPDPNTQPELYKKVTEVQKHSRNHTRTCFKSVNSGCRFGFPKPPCRQTMITRPDEDDHTSAAKEKLRPLYQLLIDPQTASMTLDQLLAQCNLTMAEYEGYLHSMTRKTALVLKRQPKDSWINNYNPHLLEAWDSNIDVSYILNAYSCIEYLTKYITKKESGLSDYLKTVMDNAHMDRVNECDEMRALMQAYSKKREISAQECVTRACGLHMKKGSRTVVFVPTDDNPVRMSRPLSFLENTTDDCCNIWMTSLSDKYKARPETAEYEGMCLADFASTCRFVSANKSKSKNVLPLLNDLGFVQRRRKDKAAVIRYYHCSQEKHPEQFYGRLLKLYVPHRSDSELKSEHFPTYQSFYQSGVSYLPGSEEYEFVIDIVKRNRKRYEKNSEEIESALLEFEDNGDQAVDEWCNLAPESDVVRVQCDDDLQADEADNEQENVPDYNPQSNAGTEVRAFRVPPSMDPAVLRGMYQNLNQKQACVFYAVRDWCIKRVCQLDPEPFFLYVNGGAGTGKSHLIKCIYSEASKILRKLPARAEEADISNPTVLLTAFTGTAAFNICGTTLHSLLKLPRSLKPPICGLGNQLDEVRAELFNAEIMIIDEISMVSRPLFAYVDARLKQIKGSQKPFGGMSVLAVGDFYQLPPVRQSKPLCVFQPSDIDLWWQHFQVVTLTDIMRQKDDVAFAELLNRLRVKEKTEELSQEDRDLLSQTITDASRCPTDVLHIFATNKQVDEHNCATLTLLHPDVISIDADDFQKDPQTGRMTRQDKPGKGGRNELADTLKVAEGVRVMLTRNIDIQNGLVNGAFGKLLRVVSSGNDQHIIKLGLRMDNQVRNNQTGAADDLVYIERAEENLKQRRVVRRQFPVRLAFACTVHKTQGLTTSAAVVSLKNIFEPGMAYVALSRVTALSGLYLLDMDERKIYANPEITAALHTMRPARVDHTMPLLQVREAVSRPHTLTIVHHNTEGLASHISDIRSHHEMCLADVLCLTETHLQGSSVAESLQLDGYAMFRRNRHVSYTNLPHMASRGGGGVAVYVRNYIQVQHKQYLHNVTDLEFVVLKLQAPFQALIAAVYRPPDYSVSVFLQNLVSLLDSLEVMDCHPIIVSGDFNENQLLMVRKPIVEMFQSRGYKQLITSATTEKNTLLDLIFISQPQPCLSSGVMRTYHSYHNPVFCVLSFSQT